MMRGWPSVRLSRSRRGAASALMILMLVLLIFFGVLALVTAAADLRLASRRAEWNKQFYLADSQALAVLASVDRFCAQPSVQVMTPVQAADLLQAQLEGLAAVHQVEVTAEALRLVLDILVFDEAQQAQGIHMRLLVRPGIVQAGQKRIIIEQWIQWQPPFDYEGGSGGIWEG